MKHYNPNIHHRKSIRLKGYDYSRKGLYFVTICCKNRACLFGKIENGKMFLNESGIMIEKWYFELENKYPDIKCHEMIVMPNHIHFIIENTGDIATVRANLGVRPDEEDVRANLGVRPDDIGQTHRSAPTTAPTIAPTTATTDEQQIFGEHIGSPLHRVIQWFKTMTTNEYIRGVKNLGWEPFYKKLWQRNYWEHIIRNENSYQNISNYIISNPSKWKEDKLNN
ncbi:MAG: transposase [Candidatus Methylacidiphilales bacterium]